MRSKQAEQSETTNMLAAVSKKSHVVWDLINLVIVRYNQPRHS